MISSWRRTEDSPAEAGLEGWISDLAGGETSVRRLRKRIEATRDEPDEAVDGPLAAPDHELDAEMARLVS